jgi:hypothetical protein
MSGNVECLRIAPASTAQSGAEQLPLAQFSVMFRTHQCFLRSASSLYMVLRLLRLAPCAGLLAPIEDAGRASGRARVSRSSHSDCVRQGSEPQDLTLAPKGPAGDCRRVYTDWGESAWRWTG